MSEQVTPNPADRDELIQHAEKRGGKRSALVEAPDAKRKRTAKDFGPGPDHDHVERLKAAAKARALEEAKKAKATRPDQLRGTPARRDMFAVGDENARRELKTRGLEVVWVNEAEEAQEYLDMGYRLARRSDVGGLRDMVAEDSLGADGVLRRREMIGVLGPIAWRQERMAREEQLAHAQMGKQQEADAALGLTGQLPRLPGRFGKQKRIPRLSDDAEFALDDEAPRE